MIDVWCTNNLGYTRKVYKINEKIRSIIHVDTRTMNNVEGKFHLFRGWSKKWKWKINYELESKDNDNGNHYHDDFFKKKLVKEGKYNRVIGI